MSQPSQATGSRPTGRRLAALLANLALTASILTWLLWRVDWALMESSLDGMHSGAIGLAFVSFLLIAALEVARLRVVLTPFSLSWRDLVRLHVIGVFFGNFLPGQLGADLYKVVVLRPLDHGVARPLTLVFLLRLVGLAVLLTAVLGGLLFRGPALVQPSGSLGWTSALPLAMAAGVGVLAISVVLIRFGLRFALFERARRFLQHTREAVRSVTGEQIGSLFGLSLLILGARALVVVFLASAVGYQVAFLDTVFVVAFATVITLVPISFAGWGLREGALTWLLVDLAVGYEEAVLVALVSRGFIVVLSAVGGVWLVHDRGGEAR